MWQIKKPWTLKVPVHFHLCNWAACTFFNISPFVLHSESKSYVSGSTQGWPAPWDWRLNWEREVVMEDPCERCKRACALLGHMLMPLVHHHPTVLPRKRRQAQPHQLMMTIYTWNEDVWLAFKLCWVSRKLHLPMRSVTKSGAVRLCQYSNAVNMKLLQICFCHRFVLEILLQVETSTFSETSAGKQKPRSIPTRNVTSESFVTIGKYQFLWWIRFFPSRFVHDLNGRHYLYHLWHEYNKNHH